MTDIRHLTEDEAVIEALRCFEQHQEDQAVEFYLDFLDDPGNYNHNRKLLKRACDRGVADLEREMRELLKLPKRRAA